MNNLKNTDGFYSKSSQKSIKGNLLLLNYYKKQFSKKNLLFSSSTPNIFQKKILDNYNKCDYDIFTIGKADKEKIDEIANDIIKNKVENNNYFDHSKSNKKPNTSVNPDNSEKKKI